MPEFLCHRFQLNSSVKVVKWLDVCLGNVLEMQCNNSSASDVLLILLQGHLWCQVNESTHSNYCSVSTIS